MSFNQEYGYTNPFSVCFTSLKMRYQDYDKSISQLNFVTQEDSVNVFISFESVLNNLSCIQDLDNKLLLERKFPTILEAEMINLCAHYKRFFKGNGLPTKIFLYCTDLLSDSFNEFQFIEDYRSFYCNKYLRNPKFQLLGAHLSKQIIPKVAKVLEFIPDVYLVVGKNIEGSLIPAIIAKQYPKSKNFIVTTDRFETQYMLNPNFCTHFIRKSRYGSSVICSFEKYILDYLKEDKDCMSLAPLYLNPSFFSILMSAMGDKMRSVDSLRGVGLKTVTRMLQYGLNNGIITAKTASIDLLKMIFAAEHQDDVVNNYKCVDLNDKLNRVTEEQIVDIKSQIMDRFDFNSLIHLNRTEYSEHPLMLEALTC